MNNPLTTTRKLNKSQLAQLSSFTDPATILNTLARNNWTVEESIEKLVEIAKGDGKESVKLGAIKYLNQMLLDAMQRSGLIVTAQRKLPGADGEVVTFTGSIVSNSLNSQKEGMLVDTDTKPEDIAQPLVIVENENAQEDAEENKENKENKEGEESPEDVDMSVCKPPTGEHASTQFGGIATAYSGTTDTIHIL